VKRQLNILKTSIPVLYTFKWKQFESEPGINGKTETTKTQGKRLTNCATFPHLRGKENDADLWNILPFKIACTEKF